MDHAQSQGTLALVNDALCLTYGLIDKATAFKFWGLPDSPAYDVTVEKRSEGRWAVCMVGGLVFDRRITEFVYEPSPSNRDDEFKQNTRFALPDAVLIAEQIAVAFEQQYQTYVKTFGKERMGFKLPPIKA